MPPRGRPRCSENAHSPATRTEEGQKNRLIEARNKNPDKGDYGNDDGVDRDNDDRDYNDNDDEDNDNVRGKHGTKSNSEGVNNDDTNATHGEHC